MKLTIIVLLFLFLSTFFCSAQDTITAWDNTISKNWPAGIVPVEIKSSADGKTQEAIFYKSTQAVNQPLIVSLHTWSGDYLQEDPLAAEVVLRDWNYIHPDFRGPNNNPEACGSEKVISDIEDAIRFAIKEGNVNENEVHIIGVSGGGYATLLAFMKLNYPVKSFSAYASISNLEDWYWECKGRGLKYAGDLEGVTTNGNGFDAVEAQKRSPALMDFPGEKRNGASLFIYTGVHDGYTGSVPVTHSINMYNRLLKEMYPEQKNKLVSDSLKREILTRRAVLKPETNLFMGGRQIHLIRELPLLSLIIFEGGHEMIVPQALALIPVYDERNTKKLNIMTIGDSNGAAENGWPVQLRKLFPFSTVINKSISGNTIGFDNLDQEKLNTLKNIDRYLEEAYKELVERDGFDFILINLGTNDAKKVFEKQQKEVSENMAVLVEKINQFVTAHNKKKSVICIITPSPMDEQQVNQEKYGGGDQRIQKNNKLFKKIALKNQVDYLDTYTTLKKKISEKTTDGVHLNEKAQFEMACEIADYLNRK
jgi:lysophospholipase L1-like esterase/pimeloyl-ACP methyl ester carboxylesterase